MLLLVLPTSFIYALLSLRASSSFQHCVRGLELGFTELLGGPQRYILSICKDLYLRNPSTELSLHPIIKLRYYFTLYLLIKDFAPIKGILASVGKREELLMYRLPCCTDTVHIRLPGTSSTYTPEHSSEGNLTGSRLKFAILCGFP